jgi:hypothetical protein
MIGRTAQLARPLARAREKLGQALTSMQNHPLRWAVGLGLFLLINSYIIYRLYKEWPQVQAISWAQMDLRWLALSATIQFIGLCILINGWRFVLHQFGIHIRFRDHFKIYTLSLLAKKLPGIGLDVLSRVYLYRRHGDNAIQVSVTSILEIVILGLAAAVVALLTMLLPAGYSEHVPPLLLLGILALFVVLIPSPLFRSFLTWVSRGEENHQQLRWYHLFAWVGVNVITITLGGLTLFFFALAFGRIEASAMIPLIQGWAQTIAAGTLLVAIPGGSYINNGVLVLILSTMMPTPEALVLLIAWRIWNTCSELVWGAIGFVL